MSDSTSIEPEGRKLLVELSRDDWDQVIDAINRYSPGGEMDLDLPAREKQTEGLNALRRALRAALSKEDHSGGSLEKLKRLVDRQAEDDGLWFDAPNANTAYIQQELRKLHEAVEVAAELSAPTRPQSLSREAGAKPGDPDCICQGTGLTCLLKAGSVDPESIAVCDCVLKKLEQLRDLKQRLGDGGQGEAGLQEALDVIADTRMWIQGRLEEKRPRFSELFASAVVERLDKIGAALHAATSPQPVPSCLSEVAEDCKRCGRSNVIWYAASPLWNAVIRSGSINGDPRYDDMVCPLCFMELAEEQGIATAFRVTAEKVNVELETTTPSGRVWDEEKFLWVDPAASLSASSDTGGADR